MRCLSEIEWSYRENVEVERGIEDELVLQLNYFLIIWRSFFQFSWKIYFSLEWNRERCNWKCKAVHSGENVSFVGHWRKNGTVGKTFCWGDFMKSQCWMGKISNLMLDRYDCFHGYVRYVLSTWQELSSRWKVSIPTGCIWRGCNPSFFWTTQRSCLL